jgi:hypothetical protein
LGFELLRGRGFHMLRSGWRSLPMALESQVYALNPTSCFGRSFWESNGLLEGGPYIHPTSEVFFGEQRSPQGRTMHTPAQLLAFGRLFGRATVSLRPWGRTCNRSDWAQHKDLLEEFTRNDNSTVVCTALCQIRAYPDPYGLGSQEESWLDSLWESWILRTWFYMSQSAFNPLRRSLAYLASLSSLLE